VEGEGAKKKVHQYGQSKKMHRNLVVYQQCAQAPNADVGIRIVQEQTCSNIRKGEKECELKKKKGGVERLGVGEVEGKEGRRLTCLSQAQEGLGEQSPADNIYHPFIVLELLY
jgi:hypothetical protein